MLYGTNLISYNLFCDVIFLFILVLPRMQKLLSNTVNLLTLIQLLTHPPCKCALTGQGSRVYPNDWGSQVYPNGWGSRVYPNGWGSQVYPNSWGSRARPGQGRRCAWASPLQLALRAHCLGFALAVCATPSRFGLCPDNN